MKKEIIENKIKTLHVVISSNFQTLVSVTKQLGKTKSSNHISYTREHLRTDLLKFVPFRSFKSYVGGGLLAE